MTPGQNTTAVADPCDIKYYRPQCGAFTSSIIIQVTDVVGSTNVFVSTRTENPGPYNFTVFSSATPFKTISFQQNGTIRPVFIGVQGVAATNSFIINVYSGKLFFCFDFSLFVLVLPLSFICFPLFVTWIIFFEFQTSTKTPVIRSR